MKRLFVFLLVLVFLLGCDLSTPVAPTASPTQVAAADTHTPEPTTDVHAVETEANQTLEVMLLTLSPDFTETPVPTDTVIPSDTPLPTNTSTLTPTLTPSSTITPIPSPTVDYQSPSAGLGSFTYLDTFDNDLNWNTYSDGASEAQVLNGKFIYTIFAITNPTAWTLSWMESQNFYAKVTAQTGPVCEGKDAYGMFFRAASPSHGYFVALSCDGSYRIVRVDSTGVEILRYWIKNDAINAGPSQTNELGVWMNAHEIRVYINGKYIDSVVDTTFVERGRFGLLVGNEKTPDFYVKFDDFVFWDLP